MEFDAYLFRVLGVGDYLGQALHRDARLIAQVYRTGQAHDCQVDERRLVCNPEAIAHDIGQTNYSVELWRAKHGESPCDVRGVYDLDVLAIIKRIAHLYSGHVFSREVCPHLCVARIQGLAAASLAVSRFKDVDCLLCADVKQPVELEES